MRADTFGYLQRSFPGVVSANDAKEARAVGRMAVQVRRRRRRGSGSVAIRRKPGKTYKVFFERVPLENVAKETRHMPDEFINAEGNDVTQTFLDYAAPIVARCRRSAASRA